VDIVNRMYISPNVGPLSQVSQKRLRCIWDWSSQSEAETQKRLRWKSIIRRTTI
jgi:hypothetical protein